MSHAPASPLSITWTPALAVGIPDLDLQHGELFRRAERLVRALDRTLGRASDEVDPLVLSLSDFAFSHLECEERWMTEVEYPGLAAHREAHWRFRDDVRAMTRAYQREGASPAMAVAVHHWLSGWLVPHLGGADLELGRWLAQRGHRRPGG